MDWILDRYRPRPEWFAHDPDGIHGIAHVTRVLVWAEQLAAWMHDHGRPVDVEVVRCAAVTHDVGRHDDGRDPEHGRRSARWVRAHRAALPVALDDQQLERPRVLLRVARPARRAGAGADERAGVPEGRRRPRPGAASSTWTPAGCARNARGF